MRVAPIIRNQCGKREWESAAQFVERRCADAQFAIRIHTLGKLTRERK